MSYSSQKKGNNYNGKISISKTTITKEVSNEEEQNKPNDYDNETLNEVIKSFEYFDMKYND